MTAYATLTDFKQGIDYPIEDASRDVPMQLCLDAASAVIDQVCNRPDGFVAQVASERTYLGTDADYVLIDECIAVSLVETCYTFGGAWETLTSWWPISGDPKHPLSQPPYNGLVREGGLFTAYRYATVRVTAQWGHSVSAPQQVKNATIAQASRWYKRGESAWSDSSASGELGQLLYRKALDPDIEMMLKNGRLMRPTV